MTITYYNFGICLYSKIVAKCTGHVQSSKVIKKMPQVWPPHGLWKLCGPMINPTLTTNIIQYKYPIPLTIYYSYLTTCIDIKNLSLVWFVKGILGKQFKGLGQKDFWKLES
jgi:hypothetical protein